MHATHVRLRHIPLHTLKHDAFGGLTRLIELELNNTGLRHVESAALNTLMSLQVSYLFIWEKSKASEANKEKGRKIRQLSLFYLQKINCLIFLFTGFS
jgi:hypothetical protein